MPISMVCGAFTSGRGILLMMSCRMSGAMGECVAVVYCLLYDIVGSCVDKMGVCVPGDTYS